MAQVVNRLWKFGDGYISARQNPTHTYKMPGKYNWSYTSTDADGNTATTSGTITVTNWSSSSSGLNVSRTNESLRYGLNLNQGIGYSKNTGDSWPKPEARTGAIAVVDSVDQLRTLVLDHSDGKFWDISTRDSYSGSNLTKVYKDKVTSGGTGGADIAPSVTFKEDRGNFEHYFIEHQQSHFYLRPQSEENRGVTASGYNASGFPSGITFTSYMYVDGEQTTADATAEDLGIRGDVHYDRTKKGHRIYHKFSGDQSEFQLIARQSYYKVADIPTNPDNRITTEGDYQEDLASPLMWYTRGPNLSRDRISRTDATGTVTAVTGPDGRANSAMETSGAVTLGSVTTSAEKSVMLWASGTVALSIGGSGISLNSYDSDSGWHLYYVNSVTASGTVILTPSLTIRLFDIRLYTKIADSLDSHLNYMYNDVTQNSGDNICPIF